MVELSHEEAVALAEHLEMYIIQEVQDVGDLYDNMDYLVTLVHIYERCKQEGGGG